MKKNLKIQKKNKIIILFFYLKVKEEAYFLISNILRNSTQEQFEILYNLDLLEVVYWGLKTEQTNIIIPSLDIVYFLLNYAKNHLSIQNNEINVVAEKIRSNGILHLIEELQKQQSKDVYERSFAILDSFFTIIEEEI